MNPGKLDRRITIQARATTRDALGGVVVAVSDFATVWAAKEDRSGSELGLAGALRRDSGTIFTIRFIEALTTQHRIFYKNTAYDIVGIQEIGRRQYQTLTCRTVEAAAA